MPAQDKPYRVYRGGRAKGRVPLSRDTAAGRARPAGTPPAPPGAAPGRRRRRGRWIGLGLVLLEAAAFGCPAVAARVEGVPEVVRDGHNGLLFEQGDVESASRQIARLAADESLRLALGDRARQDAAGRSSATMKARYLDLYRQLGLAS